MEDLGPIYHAPIPLSLLLCQMGKFHFPHMAMCPEIEEVRQAGGSPMTRVTSSAHSDLAACVLLSVTLISFVHLVLCVSCVE